MNAHLQKNAKYTKGKSLLYCTFIYALIIGACHFLLAFFDGFGPFYSVLIVDLIATLLIWLCGLYFANASLYDPYWSVIPAFIGLYWFGLYDGNWQPNQIMLMTVLLLWAVRLTLNWARSWPGLVYEDWRYIDLREKHGKNYQWVNLGGIHLFPTILVFMGMIPAYYVLTETNTSNGILDDVALIIGVWAVIIEFAADEQLKKFVKTNTVKGATLKTGLWKYSRHPNYFGEITFWFSLYLFALSISIDLWWTGIGFVSMLLLFWFISIPMMDERMKKRRTNYDEHMKSTSRLFLWPPKSN